MASISAGEFNDICSKFVQKYQSANITDELRRNGYAGWNWVSHPTWPAFSYMVRTTAVRYTGDQYVQESADELEEEEDLEQPLQPFISSVSDNDRLLSVLQYIVYSPSFQVPAFYFVVSDANGTPVPLEDIVKTSLFRPGVLQQSAIHQTHISLDEATSEPVSSVFPLLSQGDHPVLQTRCWYFHPCETQQAVKELLVARQAEVVDGKTMGAEEWLEVWMLVLGSVLNLVD